MSSHVLQSQPSWAIVTVSQVRSRCDFVWSEAFSTLDNSSSKVHIQAGALYAAQTIINLHGYFSALL